MDDPHFPFPAHHWYYLATVKTFLPHELGAIMGHTSVGSAAWLKLTMTTLIRQSSKLK